MQSRALVAVVLFMLPIGVNAQVRVPPTGGGATPIGPTHPSPQIPSVARQLAQQRSRWSTEAYSLISSIQIPTAPGFAKRYTTLGAGSRTDRRFSDRFSATLDVTASLFGDPARTETVELGGRYRPLLGLQKLSPFVGVRAAYMHMSNSFVPQTETTSGFSGGTRSAALASQSSHGAGGVVGAGVDYSLTPSFALTSELSAMRNRLTVYRSGSTGIPEGTLFWTTASRLMLGIKYTPRHVAHLAQNPTR